MRVAVLKGGLSAEREVSLSSGAACAKACRELGYDVTEIDVQSDIAAVLAQVKPDKVFNALHGRFGEDGCIQGILEILKIPYTHSGVLASALAMDKPMAIKVFAAAGLNVAESRMACRDEVIARDVLPRPYVIKPHNEGSSVGVKLMFEGDKPFTKDNWPYGYAVMVEKYIPGRELTVAVLDDEPLGVTEITTKSGFYDYDNKYTAGGSTHICPADLPKPIYDEAMRMALVAHKALGCRGLSRSDFRYDEKGDGKIYILETNTQPGMTPLSLSPELAAMRGISFNELVKRLLDGAQLDG
ncbi:MAG: D-alanine--D-alanine ligase [Alphaproteobacteria bacterium]|nr:D-alanine--D-alanine ligase [Alphaproteobacteria bacterium]